MELINSCTEGFRKTFSSARIVTVIYGSVLLLGLMLAGSFNTTITGNLNSRPELYKLLGEFDFKIYSDFLNAYGEMIYPFINQMFWIASLYLLFTIFFTGGILRNFELSPDKNKVPTFFANCAKYFFRFLRLGIYVLMIQLIVFLIIAVIFGSVFADAMESSPEPTLAVILSAWIAVQLFVFFFLAIVSDYAKIILVKEDSKKVWRALWGGFKFSLKRIFVAYSLFLLLLLFPLALTVSYFWLDSIIGMSRMLTVLVMALIQQGFIWARIYCKVWILGSEYEFFNNYKMESTKPVMTQEMLITEDV